MKTSPQALCEGLPTEIRTILEYCLDLEYYEDPDYNFIHSELSEMYQNCIGERPFAYDWAKLPEEVSIEKDDKVIVLSPEELRYPSKGGKSDEVNGS